MLMKPLAGLALVFGLSVVAGCTTPETGAMDLDAAAGIEAANATFMAMMAEGNVEGLVALYTSDGSLLPPGAPMAQGTVAIAEMFGGFLSEGGVDLKLETMEIHGEGESVTEVGRATVRTLDGTLIDEGNYIVVWRYVNGEWKLHRDMWNSTLADDVDDGDGGDDDDDD